MANEGTIQLSTILRTTSNYTVAGTKTFTDTTVFSKTQDAHGTLDYGPALIVGGTRTTAHIEIDNNEVLAKASGTAVSNLYLNQEGGSVVIGAGGLVGNTFTASTAVYADANKKLVSSPTTSVELGYVHGVTSAIQTQLNTKAALASPTLTGTPKSSKPASSNSTTDTNIATTGWVNDPSYSTNVVHRTGDETIAGNKTFSSTINGEAMYARWGDLAEIYMTDYEYKPGTLVQFGGSEEMTLAITEANAVVSTKPGVLINQEESGNKHALPVALIGKVPVRVIGSVKKFDRIMLSETPGVATKKTLQGQAIGVCLADKLDEDEGLVLCSVKLMF